MNDLRQAAEMALEALEWCDPERVEKELIALRQALAQPEQEPVAEIQIEDMGRPFSAMRVTTHFYKEVPAVGTKLYTAPPKQWVGLTDEEIKKLQHIIDWIAGWTYGNFARAIEAKLKENT